MRKSKKSAPAKSLSWKARVQRALGTLGPGEHTRAEVIAAVGRQRFKRSATWKQTVSRTLQELRDKGLISFDSKGHYHSFDEKAQPPEVIAKRVEDVLSASFQVTSFSIKVTTPNKFDNGYWHYYKFNVVPDESDGRDETIAQATLAFAKWYSSKTMVGIEVMSVDDEGEEVGYQWATLAWAETPLLASGHIEFSFDQFGIQGKYQLTDQIATIGFRLKEKE